MSIQESLSEGLVFADGTEVVCQIHKIPDYCNDLNAMHEAVGTLGVELGPYEYWLEKVAGPGMCMVEATARQRAEAFVLAMGERCRE
jgi:hypothetical protein